MKYRFDVTIDFEHDDVLPDFSVEGPLKQVQDQIGAIFDKIMQNHDEPDSNTVRINARMKMVELS